MALRVGTRPFTGEFLVENAARLGPTFCALGAAREGDRLLGLSAEGKHRRSLELATDELDGEQASSLAVTIDAEGCRLLAAAANTDLAEGPAPSRRRAWVVRALAAVGKGWGTARTFTASG